MSNSNPHSVPTKRVGQLLFVAAQAAQTLALERLEPLGLSPRGWGVLSTLLEAGPLTQIKLANTLSIDRTAMVYLLDELEASGLVERVRDPSDRRAFLIRPTAAGRQLQRKAARELAGQSETLLKPLDKAEREQFIGMLARITEHWQARSAGSGTTPASATGRGAPRARPPGR